MDKLFSLFTLLAQTGTEPGAPKPEPGGGGGSSSLMLIMLMFFGIYFLMIAPQRRRQKEAERMLGQVKRGDRVIFGNGIYGTVMAVKEEKDEGGKAGALKSAVVTIEIDKNTRVDVRRDSISAVLSE